MALRKALLTKSQKKKNIAQCSIAKSTSLHIIKGGGSLKNLKINFIIKPHISTFLFITFTKFFKKAKKKLINKISNS